MRLEAIRSFLKLVERGSYVTAADELFLSSTTLHSHIRSIEEELDATLVSFEGRRMDLTRAGSQFLVFAERTISDFHALREELSGIRRPAQATLRVVSLHAPGTYLVPPVVKAFQAAHPEVHIVVDARRTGEALAAMVSGEADLAIVHDAHADHVRDVLEVSVVFEDRLAAVVRKELYSPPDVSLLERYPLAAQPVQNFSRQHVERWAKQQGVRIRTQFEHTSFDGILMHVLTSDCVGVLGGYVARLSPLLSHIRILDLPHFEYSRRIVALYPTRSSETVRRFVEFFCGYYEDDAMVRGRS